jgi:NAD(P)-dependent dehydrogenase (short-subunit alcohol dehydrogenase family)
MKIPPMFDLAGRTAIVTGSSRGIGRAIATAFADHGAKVIISSRKQEACDEVADEINAVHADAAMAVAANISSRDDLEALVARTQSAHGKIDILVCNAATNPFYGPMSEIPDVQFRKVLENNILSTHWLCQMVAPGMVSRREGAIIIVSSIGGMSATTKAGAYNVSKAADIQLARNLSAELGPSGVTANCIAPGLVRTDFARALWENPATLARLEQAATLRRIAEPEEIAGVAVFLAARAGRFVTGQTIVVDGGATIAGFD